VTDYDLDVNASLVHAHEAARAAVLIAARNTGDQTMTLISCAILLPSGLRIFAETAEAVYPFDLAPGTMITERFPCQRLAERLSGEGEHGSVRLDGVFFEEGTTGFGLAYSPLMPYPKAPTFGVIGIEHRCPPFTFDVARWL